MHHSFSNGSNIVTDVGISVLSVMWTVNMVKIKHGEGFQHRGMFRFTIVVFLLHRSVENSLCSSLAPANLPPSSLRLFKCHPARSIESLL